MFNKIIAFTTAILLLCTMNLYSAFAAATGDEQSGKTDKPAGELSAEPTGEAADKLTGGAIDTLTSGAIDKPAGEAADAQNAEATNGNVPSGSKFQDIQTHWAKDYIDTVTQLGLFNGTTETTFSPNQTITRGMFITVLGRMSGAKESDFTGKVAELPFADVKPGAYYAPFIAWGLSKNIVSGVSKDAFAPDKEITRQEMCVMLFNLARSADLIANPDLKSPAFSDADSISSWAKSSVSALSAVGLIEGFNGAFNPTGLSTRAEAAALIARFTYSLGLA